MPADAQASAAMNRARRMDSAGSGVSYFGHFFEHGQAAEYIGRPRRSGPKHQPKKTASSEKILQAFNTWAFKREQPDNADTMQRTIAAAVKDDRPILFILYWGKGPRNQTDMPDTTCLEYLSALARRVAAAYEPGASITLIFTDTHAALNGHSPQNIQQYFAAVAAKASSHGFTGRHLSEFIGMAPADGARCARSISELPEEARQKLIACAAKWFRGEGSPEEGALRYYQMNLIEKQAVEAAFPSAIFVTFNGSEFRCLFPDRLPVFYMYSLRRGVSAKPWFLSSETLASASLPAIDA